MNKKYNLYVIMTCMLALQASLYGMNTTARFTDLKSAYEAKLKQAQDLAVGVGGMTLEQLKNFHNIVTQARDALHTIDVEAGKIAKSPAISSVRKLGITDEYIAQQRALLDNLQTTYTAAQAALTQREATAAAGARALLRQGSEEQARGQEEIQRLRTELDALRAQLKASQDAVAQAQKQLADMQRQRDARPTQEQLDAAIATGMQSQEQLAHIAKLEQERAARLQEIKQLQEQAAKLRQELNARPTQEQLTAAQTTVQQAQDVAQQAKDQAAKAQQELNARPTAQDIQKLQEQLNARPTQEQLVVAQRELQQAKDQFAAQIAEAKRATEAARAECKNAQQHIAGLEQGYGRMGETLKSTEKERDEIARQLAASKQQLTTAQEARTQAEAELKQAREKHALALKKCEDELVRVKTDAKDFAIYWRNLGTGAYEPKVKAFVDKYQ